MTLADIAPATTISFDLTEIPFSRRGSWLDLSPVTALHTQSEDIHVVSHVGGIHAVLKLVPTLAGKRVATTVHGGVSRLLWTSESGTVEAVFESNETIRLRGRGLGMRIEGAAPRLASFTGDYLFQQPADNAAVLTSYETGRRYRITTLAGASKVVGAEHLGKADRWVELGEDSEWEVAIEETTASRILYRSLRSFDQSVAATDDEFGSYADQIASRLREAAPAAQLAAYVMWSATVSPGGFLERESMLMSKHWMDHVWSWDHCFNAIALLPSGLDGALNQFSLPFDRQDATGALPDSIAHSKILYNYVKPPIHGWGLDRLRELSSRPIEEASLREIYDGLANWTRFWLEHRRVPGHAIPYYEHGNDSGWDNSTMFDLDRVIEAPDLASFLIVQLETLTNLASELDLKDEWAPERDRILAALVEELWNGEAFVAKSAHSGRYSTTTSLLNAMPVFVADRLPKDIAQRLADQVARHMTEWGPATELVDSRHYEADGYWRGPIWAPSTALIEDGLRRAGFIELADEISLKFRHLCETSGFAENFDALTGEGLRDRAYTWTASVYLMFAADEVRRSARTPS